MNNPAPALYADLHPVDLISRAKDKLVIVNSFLTDNDEGKHPDLNIKAMNEGVFWLLDSITCELDFAVAKLNEEVTP